MRDVAVLSYGFRPFFFAGALWAAVSMVLWIGALSGALVLPAAFDPISWHAHAFLFGYLGAIIAGFLLTAVPNWTGHPPVTGWPLGALLAIWLAGRIAVICSVWADWRVIAAVDLAFPLLLAGIILRELLRGRAWKNLPVLALVLIHATANGVFHHENAHGAFAAQGYGMRLGLAAVVMMIAVIGGRIIPAFTRNWLAKRGGGTLPAPPMQSFDKAVLAATVVALILWAGWPARTGTAAALIIIGALHLVRLARWRGWRTQAEPLVGILHVAYGFVPLGALGIGGAALAPQIVQSAPMLHLWMAGAAGTMTLAVMTRATLGHTGQALHAGPGTSALYVMMITSVLARLAAGLWPALPFIDIAGILWIGAFGGYAALYGPRLVRRAVAQS